MVTNRRCAQVVCPAQVALTTAEAFKYQPLVAYSAKLGFALSKPNARKHLATPYFSSLDAATTCARRARHLHVFWRRRNGQRRNRRRESPPTSRHQIVEERGGGGGQVLSLSTIRLASYHTCWPNFQGSFGPSFPSFRQLAAPWAKRYDGRRGPMAADYASRLRSRMFLCASSARCFVAEAVRTRNRNTMVPLFDPVWELPCPLAPLLREARYRQ